MTISQTERLYFLLSDGLAHRTDEIVRKIYGDGNTLARVGARIADIKARYKVQIHGWHDPKVQSLYWYHIKKEGLLPECEKCQDIYAATPYHTPKADNPTPSRLFELAPISKPERWTR